MDNLVRLWRQIVVGVRDWHLIMILLLVIPKKNHTVLNVRYFRLGNLIGLNNLRTWYYIRAGIVLENIFSYQGIHLHQRRLVQNDSILYV